MAKMTSSERSYVESISEQFSPRSIAKLLDRNQWAIKYEVDLPAESGNEDVRERTRQNTPVTNASARGLEVQVGYECFHRLHVEQFACRLRHTGSDDKTCFSGALLEKMSLCKSRGRRSPVRDGDGCVWL